MAEAKRGPIINFNTRLPFMREDEASLPSLPSEGWGNDWRIAAQFLSALAESQLETYPHYDLVHPASKGILLNELNESNPIDIVPHLIALEPLAMLTNLTDPQLTTVMEALSKLGNPEKTLTARMVTQGLLLGRQTAK